MSNSTSQNQPSDVVAAAEPDTKAVIHSHMKGSMPEERREDREKMREASNKASPKSRMTRS